MATSPARAALERFLSKYDPAIARLSLAAVDRLRRRIPGANALVFDNYNACVVAFGPGQKATDMVLSVAAYPRWVTLFFRHGAGLPDPAGRLEGSGKEVRSLRLVSADDLAAPHVEALVVAALSRARTPVDPAGRGELIVKSVSKAQRPRRPATAARPARLPSRTFTASPIARHGMLFIPVPFDLKATFGHGRPPVVVAIRGYTYRSTPSIYGDEPMVPLRREHREVVGAQAGRRLRVTLALDGAPRTIEPPPDLARALRAGGLQQAWAALAPSHQREHAQAILQAKRPETRARRVERAVAALRAKRRG